MNWLAATLESYGGLPITLSWILLGCFALFFGLEHGVFVWVAGRVARGPATVLILAACWIVLEVQRGFFWRGFPWNLAAYSWTEMPGARDLASWVGAFGVSGLVMVVNAGVAISILGPSTSTRLKTFVYATLSPLAALALLNAVSAGKGSHGDPIEQLELRVIQPNSPIVANRGEAAENYRRLIEMSLRACEDGALIVWPESATWPEDLGASEILDRDLARLMELGCGVLLNTAIAAEGQWRNAVVLIDRGVRVGEYSKRRLVPWGEYVPLAKWFPFVGRLARNAGDFAPGKELGLIPWQGEELAVAICYEIVFGGAVAEQVRAGATVLITVTNDAWYGDTAAPWQHFRAARWRAAENRRPVIRAGLTGVSALISQDGTVEELLSVGERGIIVAQVSGGRQMTVFTMAPWAIPAGSVVVVIFGIVRARMRSQPQ